jgi:uncharacterized SAM-binding protein YcdF (DUF218 family)
MFFFFSKTAGYLAQPMVIVCLVFLAGFIVKKPRLKKGLRIASLILFIIFSNQFLAYTAMRAWEIRPVPFAEVDGVYDYGVVLTGITKGQAGPGDRVYFGDGVDRATHSMQLYKLGIIKKMIISGGSGKLLGGGVLEADELATFMVLAGVRPEDIVIENKSRNTHESAVEVGSLLNDMPGSKRLLLITSGYHLRRARACFIKAGLPIDIFSTNPLAFPGTLSLDMFIVPKAEAFRVWHTLFKEWTGMIAYKLAGYI